MLFEKNVQLRFILFFKYCFQKVIRHKYDIEDEKDIYQLKKSYYFKK